MKWFLQLNCIGVQIKLKGEEGEGGEVERSTARNSARTSGEAGRGIVAWCCQSIHA